jgi:hypothetical protein
MCGNPRNYKAHIQNLWKIKLRRACTATGVTTTGLLKSSGQGEKFSTHGRQPAQLQRA